MADDNGPASQSHRRPLLSRGRSAASAKGEAASPPLVKTIGIEPAAALALRTRPGVAGPVWRGRKWIGAAPAAFRHYRRPALIERRIAAVLAAMPKGGPRTSFLWPPPPDSLARSTGAWR